MENVSYVDEAYIDLSPADNAPLFGIGIGTCGNRNGVEAYEFGVRVETLDGEVLAEKSIASSASFANRLVMFDKPVDGQTVRLRVTYTDCLRTSHRDAFYQVGTVSIEEVYPI